jgi:hypothetical protein
MHGVNSALRCLTPELWGERSESRTNEKLGTFTTEIGMKKIKKMILSLWLIIPFGNICSFKYGKLTVTVKKNFWLVMSDGESKDALPITMVSDTLVNAVAVEMKRMGYA